ncbi:hypothetical protein [Streptomyces erythrochromogenes]|uniref:hypothetical protein n=1 Tax=Streptomyces erythrochromogenes TaxID=285574 RepID=UPI002258B02A|nr:hypothetical protein [Streptomyces erythrochromogenes]MCX5587554.1 hypothetical protein [Streptomyces erythrochromogenes]
MASIARLPVFLRIGDTPEAEIATIDFPINGNGQVTVDRKAIADMLRAAANAVEHPSPDDEEVPHAAP